MELASLATAGHHQYEVHGINMKFTVSAMLVVVGLIHLLPLSGVLGNTRLEALYGVPIGGPDLEILMRHRAVLFGLLGAFLIYAAFRPSLQAAAFVAGFVSVGSFMLLAASVGGYNARLATVFNADIVALVCLAIGLVAWWRSSGGSSAP